MPSQTSQLEVGASRKRKEPEPATASPATSEPSSPAPAPAPANNRLLAGYLAHEFLTKGTLFGRMFEPMKPPKPIRSAASRSEAADKEPNEQPGRGYSEVAQLMRASGVHIPDVVNPTQLDHWLQM